MSLGRQAKTLSKGQIEVVVGYLNIAEDVNLRTHYALVEGPK